MVLAWVLIGAVLLATEIVTIAFFALFAAAGAFAGAITAAVGAPGWIQVLVAVGVALGGVIVGRPPLQAWLGPYRGRHAISARPDLLGQVAMTLDRVGDEHHPGHVLLSGERWLAITERPDGLPADVKVTIVEVRGTTLVVWP